MMMVIMMTMMIMIMIMIITNYYRAPSLSFQWSPGSWEEVTGFNFDNDVVVDVDGNCGGEISCKK